MNHAALLRRMLQQVQSLRAELASDPDADAIAQAAACAAPILAHAPANATAALPWLTNQLCPWEQLALDRAAAFSAQYSHSTTPESSASAADSVLRTPHSALRTPPPAHLYDEFLHRYSATSRKRRGVFFTPQPIADYIVAQIDRLLHDEFHLPDGLATPSQIPNPKSQILLLDPACGTGVFPLAIIDRIHRTLGCRFNAFVPSLLRRLIGIEILPAAALLAKLNIALKLAQIGYDFQASGRINIITGDALSPILQVEFCIPNSAFPILLGNPPFSSLSTTTNPWIAQLVRGDDKVRGYVRANGQVLGERKTWLHDDYVKFMRLAQWHVEQAGAGIVGFVTNHGYLDNATFRLMRHELLRVFSRIEIVDLHGNRKKHEAAPDGARDENIFGLDQGTAIGLFCRPPTQARSASEGNSPSIAEYAELWGSREHKLQFLAAATDEPRKALSPSLALRASVLKPHSPDWRFIPAPATQPRPEYYSAWSLADAMPVNATAPVTARDHFVVAFTAEELKARIAEFRDLAIPDDEIRRRYFQRTRSARYEVGDTRGWKLSEARRIIAADPDWQGKISRCLYRPFDWRYVFWHPAMIDWPRSEVTRHLMGSGFRVQGSEVEERSVPKPRTLTPDLSLCLVARRQQLPTQPCTFFWISDGLALDGVIRSDNRGSESLFPLYIHNSAFKVQSSKSVMHRTLDPEPGTLNSWQANFAPGFIDQFQAASGLSWLPLGQGDLDQSFGPEDLLAYIYALFYSPTYRERYAAALRTDFPRIPLPRDDATFASMCQRGHELIDLHLLRTPHSALRVPHLPEAVTTFRAGGYVALRKWLQPQHRSSADPQYSQIAAAITRTLEIMHSIDDPKCP